MPEINPKPEYLGLTRAEVLAALDDPDPGNPAAVEVARLIEGYTGNFAARVASLGEWPAKILRSTPRSAIEAVAMELTTAMVKEVGEGSGQSQRAQWQRDEE
jgi:hypothetical protein